MEIAERFRLYFIKFNIQKLNPECWLYSLNCKDFLANEFNIDINCIWIEVGTPKNRMASIANLKILINNILVDYTSIYSLNTLDRQELLPCFKFIFILMRNKDRRELNFEIIRKALVKEYLTTL